MTDFADPLLLAACLLIVTIVLQVIVLMRRPRVELPPDLARVLQLAERDLPALRQDVARIDGDLDRQFRAIEALTAGTAAASGTLQQTLDEKLRQTVEESRSGRRETAEGNALFLSRLESRFNGLQESLLQQLATIAASSAQTAEQLRGTLNERLGAIQTDNANKLEDMRRTVDEKLHATLEQRLGEKFQLVSDRLELVHAGLGEMKTLAGSVGDLKKVMSNVRARGTWGEVQLGAIIESILTADQYARNVKTVPGSNELVEFAVRMPGRVDDEPVWLPIDSKYPVEDYQRLIDAHESGDRGLIQQAATAFESSLRLEARKIASKYLNPPQTTDFAILFLPTEGLFAEALRIPGLGEAFQSQYRVVLAGPTTLTATLNSLRLGFRTLAIEKRSSEVWGLLGSVKTEFRKFGVIVDSTRKSIAAAANKFDELGRRTRAIERDLRAVEVLPGTAAEPASDTPLALEDDPDDEASLGAPETGVTSGP